MPIWLGVVWAVFIVFGVPAMLLKWIEWAFAGWTYITVTRGRRRA